MDVAILSIPEAFAAADGLRRHAEMIRERATSIDTRITSLFQESQSVALADFIDLHQVPYCAALRHLADLCDQLGAAAAQIFALNIEADQAASRVIRQA